MEQSAQSNFATLVARYRKDLYRWAFDLTGSHEDAEDLTQETLIKVHRSMARFRGEAKWSTWIFKIARNTHLDRLKTASHKMRVLESPMPEHPNPTSLQEATKTQANPEQKLASLDLQNELMAALQGVSKLQREVFILRHYHGFKIREIGDILNRSEGTIKTSLFRAIQSLRLALNHHLPTSHEVSS